MSNTKPHQKALLPNPFHLSDSDILEKVYLTHTYDDEVCDKQILFNVVSNVILLSSRVVETVLLKREGRNGIIESKFPITDFKPEFHKLKLMSCQMITIPSGVENAHQTTMRILQQLRTFSWDAKALIALAAFALEYGNFWNLYQLPPSDQLGNSLKLLNQIQHRQIAIVDINNLVGLVMEAVQKIKEWGTWTAEGYDTEDVPSLSDALQEIPRVVYWAVASLVACNSNFIGLSNYSLADFSAKLSPALQELNGHLEICKLQIDDVEDYLRRKRNFRKPKDVVDFLKLLIHRDESQDAQIYDGSTQNKVGVEVFKQKHILLFISTLDSIADEIRLLNSIQDRLVEDPNDNKGFKKEEFKILWIPIVDRWDDERREVFKALRNGIKWYFVDYFSPLPGIRLIREDLNFENKPIVPVVNPQGIVINNDAMDIIFEWGIDAFPFRKSDGDMLAQKWKWFWDEVRKTNFDIQVKGDRYIFIFGGNDGKWIQDFTLAVDKVKRHETIKRADAIIDYYHLGKDDPKKVPRFWIGIESKRQKKHYEVLDCEIQEIVKSLLCLKQDGQGWALLSKGSNVKILGHGEPMYQTLADFEIWKEKVLVREGFDIAFKEYYETKLNDLPAPQPCAFMNVDNYTSNVVATITCPNASCGRVMEVTSVNYKCCHRDGSDSGKV
ncbi:protein SIEVE ELEMENT OCCLUSION B-like [Abrus precatorius]|uniref:Protein SIEVE ELEMENT OCCLUSION B-like n=1 Tax=Abrus precatorius TaxID=3816 RepID=A0A8B8MCR9_ABRPR|nr:protein SIEVE ELEMENT OCCLUSION B-like [Abrus precatorius]